ncbi:MAG: hypothetical protein O3C60_04285 [Planctomycetota bacterium]|nr:hypothetical protein [Planctomycetota bacterium]
MSKGSFEGRRQALEDSFFHACDTQLVANLRQEIVSMEEKSKLSHVSGIVDEQVLSSLVNAGVQAESLLAVRLVPMVVVAWADGKVSSEERAAVLTAAIAEGISAGSTAHDLLGKWLEHQPGPNVMTAWVEFVGELARVLPSAAIAELKEKVLERCWCVAKSSGGYLGLGAVSPSEQKAIDQLKKAYDIG